MVAGSVTSAAQPGATAWDIVVGDTFIAALAAPAPDACTTALAEAAGDEGATIESLVKCIPTGGSDPVESFAIVWWPGPDAAEVTALVRGDAVVDLASPGGTRRFDAHGISPWHLADFGDVVALRMTGADAPLDRLGEAADPVRHARASLRASAIEWAYAPATVPVAVVPAASVDADTILMARPHLRSAADLFGADTIRTARRMPPRPPAAIPPVDHALAGRGPRSASSVSEPFVVSQASATSAAAVPGPAIVAPAVRRSTVPVPAFRVNGGPPHPLTVPVLIGRRPLAPRIAGISGVPPELVTVSSPLAVVSGTHLELHVEGTRIVATDLRSTNGTLVRHASGIRRMRAGESIVVAPGTSLDLGDGTIIEILLTPAAPASDPPIDSRPHP